MSKGLTRYSCGCAFGAVSVLAISLSAHAAVIPNNAVSTENDVIAGLTPLDLSSVVGSGLSGPNNSVYTTMFTSSTPGAFSGALTARVFGNVGAPGSSLHTIAIIYEFVGNGPSGIDSFEFGIDGGANLDFEDLDRATHGRIDELTTMGQGNPVVTLTNNMMVNNHLDFDFAAGGDPLGGVDGSQTYAWYISIDGAVQINVVDVVVTDFGASFTTTLALVNIPGQPDLGVPGPGALAAFGLGALALAGRRRR